MWLMGWKILIRFVLLVSVCRMFGMQPILLYAAEEENPLDGIVAVVNDDVILRSELNRFYDGLLRRSPNSEIGIGRALDTLVIRKIQLDTAERQGIYIGEDRTQDYIRNFLNANQLTAEQHAKQLEAAGSDYLEWRKEIREFLVINELQRQQLSGYIRVSPTDVDEYLAANIPPFLRQTNYDFIHTVSDAPDADALREARSLFERTDSFADLAQEEWKETDVRPTEFRNRQPDSLPRLLTERVLFMQEGEVLSFRDEDGASHLIKLLAVRYPRDSVQTEYRLKTLSLLTDIIYTSEQLEVQINDLHRRLSAGESFDELAATYGHPNAPFAAYNLEWQRRSFLPPELVAILDTMRAGELSSPLNINDSWHLLLLEERREKDVIMERLREEAYDLLVQQKLRQVRDFWLNDIRSRAYIEYRNVRTDGEPETADKI